MSRALGLGGASRSVDAMKLIILGSGTSVPHARRSAPAYWLETSSGNILLDISADAPHRMAQEGLDWPNLDAIWISHFHLDHSGGLAPFLFGMKWAPQTRKRTHPLKIFGAHGLFNVFSAVNDSNNYRLLEQQFEIDFVEVEPGVEFDFFLELAEAMRLARECAPNRLVLTHLYPEWDGIDVVSEAKTLWSGETIEATDGLRLEI